VPEDVSVMGVEDLPLAQLTSPRLTTIRHDLHHLGKTAVQKLLGMSRDQVKSCAEMNRGELVVRDSTAAPRSM